MPSTLFSRPTQPHERSPPKPTIRLKTLSYLFSRPSSTKRSPQPHPQPLHDGHIVPSNPVPYVAPEGLRKSDLALGSALTGSPFRVFISDGLPKPTLEVAGDVSGLPGGHQQLAEMSRVSAVGDKSTWREMPTLASAIHLDPPTSHTFGPFQPLHVPKRTEQPTTFPAFQTAVVRTGQEKERIPRTSSNASSLFEVYRSRTLRRSSSRSCIKEMKESAPLGRRISRRLSIDNILPIFGGGGRRKDRAVSEETQSNDKRWPAVDRAASMTSGTASLATSVAVPIKANPMVMPSARTWRSKFAVGTTKGGLLAAAKADLAARQAAKEKEKPTISTEGKEVDQRTLPRITPGRRRLSRASLNGVAGSIVGSVRKVEEQKGRDENDARWDERQTRERPSSVAASLKSAKSPSAGKSIQKQPYSSPSAFRRSSVVGTTAQPLTSMRSAAESPSPKPTGLRPSGTPLNRLSMLGLPSTSMSFTFSPAQDDQSILDPGQTPLAGSPTDDQPTPPMPMLRDAEVQDEDSPVKRKQSLHELKNAFSRMRDLSGVDVNSMTGSMPCSRRTSGRGPEEDESERDQTIRRRSQVLHRKSLDLASLDQELKAVIDQNIAKAQLENAISDTTVRERMPASTMGSRPTMEGAMSLFSSTSSGMMTAETSFTHHTSQESESLSRAQSGRSWHTAPEEEQIPPLPRSSSKSTQDLHSLSTGRDLVGQLEEKQGEGWWSTEKPSRLSRRASNIEDLRLKPAKDEEDDQRLAVLEKLAKSSTLPHRSRFPDPPSPASTASPTASQTGTPNNPRPDAEVLGSRSRAATVMGFQPQFALVGRIDRSVHGQQRSSVGDWRPSSVQPRQRPIFHGLRLSLVAGSTWMTSKDEVISPRRSVLRKPSMLASGAGINGDDTPTKPRLGPFATSRISPDIARRASWLTQRQEVQGSASLVHQSPILLRPRANDSITGIPGTTGNTEEGVQVSEVRAKVIKIKAKHQVELDTVLTALSGSKEEVKSLKDEVGTLHQLLRDGVGEREEMRGELRKMQALLEALDLTRIPISPAQRRPRTTSVTSALLPDLHIGDQSLIPTNRTLDSPDFRLAGPEDTPADEFGRKRLPLQLDPGTMRDRNVSTQSSATERSNVLDVSMESEVEDGWELKLREADERHLVDL